MSTAVVKAQALPTSPAGSASPGMASGATAGSKRPAESEAAAPSASKAPRMSESSIAVKRVMKEFEQIKKNGIEQEIGIEFSLKDPDQPMEWEVLWKYELDPMHASDTHLTIQKQLREKGLSGVRLGMKFPEDYPGNAPFVWLKGPHIYCPIIFGGGGFCAETLSANFGWTPLMRAYMLQVSLRALVENYKRVELDFTVKEHTEKSARQNTERIFEIHNRGWGTRKTES